DTPSWRSHSGRLSGLLSGCPPTDTRPQARANLGNLEISGFCRARKKNSRRVEKFFHHTREKVSRGLKIEPSERPRAPSRRARAVNGSTRIALRTKVATTNMPTRKKRICSA